MIKDVVIIRVTEVCGILRPRANTSSLSVTASNISMDVMTTGPQIQNQSGDEDLCLQIVFKAPMKASLRDFLSPLWMMARCLLLWHRRGNHSGRMFCGVENGPGNEKCRWSINSFVVEVKARAHEGETDVTFWAEPQRLHIKLDVVLPQRTQNWCHYTEWKSTFIHKLSIPASPTLRDAHGADPSCHHTKAEYFSSR